MKATEKKFERINPPEGSHIARIIRIIDMGTQHSDKFNSDQHKIRITFELVNEKYVFDEDKGEQPFLVDRQYTLNLSPKASLRKDLENWLGRKFTKKELEDGFDMAKLIGSAGQLQIVHTEVGDEIYGNINGLMSVPKGTKVPKAVNDEYILDLDDFDQEIFDQLPDWMQELIEASPEYEALSNPEGAEAGASGILD